MLPCAAYLRIYEPLSAFAADERARWSNYAASSDRPRRADRKSTRLNSSHLVISYAVFCLKKKNKCAQLESPFQHSRDLRLDAHKTDRAAHGESVWRRRCFMSGPPVSLHHEPPRSHYLRAP